MKIFIMIEKIFFFITALLFIGHVFNKKKKEKNKSNNIIINKGKINFNTMIENKISFKKIILYLKKYKIEKIRDVELALLESDGSISLFTTYDEYSDKNPITIILDGNIKNKSLQKINKNKKWLLDILKSKNIELNNVFYGFFSKNSFYIIKKD